MSDTNDKPIIVEQYTDNGEFSHWHLIKKETGEVLWSSFPEETIAQGQKIIFLESHAREMAKKDAETERLRARIYQTQTWINVMRDDKRLSKLDHETLTLSLTKTDNT